MKKLLVVLLLTALLSLTAGCASPGPRADALPAETAGADADAPVPDAFDAPPSAPSDADADIPGGYTLERSVTVDGGHELTLALHGVQNEESGTFSITAIDVYHGGTLVQTLNSADAAAAEWDEEYRPDAAESLFEDGGLTTVDMNFDGSGDIGIQGWVTAGANTPYYYWLWNASERRFKYAFCLCNAAPDAGARELVCTTASGAGCTVADRYAFSPEGALTLAFRGIDAEGEDAETSAALTALLSDVAENYHPGTAGCSLKSVKLACSMLDLFIRRAPGFDHIGAAAARFFFALDADAREEFAAKLGDIRMAARELTNDGALELMETAGCASEYAPFSPDDVDAFFGALYWGAALDEDAE